MSVPLEGGGAVILEITTASSGPIEAGRASEVVQEAAHSFQAGFVPIRNAVRSIVNQLREAGPNEVEIDFGVTLTAEIGAVIARSETGCHFNVKATWKHENVGASSGELKYSNPPIT